MSAQIESKENAGGSSDAETEDNSGVEGESDKSPAEDHGDELISRGPADAEVSKTSQVCFYRFTCCTLHSIIRLSAWS